VACGKLGAKVPSPPRARILVTGHWYHSFVKFNWWGRRLVSWPRDVIAEGILRVRPGWLNLGRSNRGCTRKIEVAESHFQSIRVQVQEVASPKLWSCYFRQVAQLDFFQLRCKSCFARLRRHKSEKKTLKKDRLFSKKVFKKNRLFSRFCLFSVTNRDRLKRKSLWTPSLRDAESQLHHLCSYLTRSLFQLSTLLPHFPYIRLCQPV